MYEKPGILEAVEEFLGGGGAGDRTADGLAQFLARGAVAALALGLVVFGAGGAFGGGAVAGGDAVEVVVGFDEAGFGLGALAGAVVVGAAAVFADEGGDDVDVVVRVADGGPAAARAVAGVDAGGRDDAAGDVGPLFVGQDRVAGGGAHRAVPHVLLDSLVCVEQAEGLVEEISEVLLGGRGVAARVGGHVVEGGDQMRIDVLLVRALAVEVAEQAEGAAALPVDAGDQAASPS